MLEVRENIMKKYTNNSVGKVFRNTINASSILTINGEKKICAVIEDGDVRIVIPSDELEIYYPYALRNKELDRIVVENFTRKMINASVPFVVTAYDTEEKVVVASRRLALELLKNRNNHNVGEIVDIHVVGTSRNYVICEFDGYIGTVGKKEFAYGTVGDLMDEIEVGVNRKAKILTLDEKNCFLSFKQTEENPFDEYVLNKEYYVKGGTYTGIIKLFDQDRIYVNLKEGLTVAVTYPFRNTKFNKRVGEQCLVTITQINKEKKHLFGAIS